MTESDNTKLPDRFRFPNRRPSITETLEAAGQAFHATIGFDPADGGPREVFLSGAKAGSGLAAILEDASVVLSVALQFGVPPSALARSVARLPTEPRAPPYLDQPGDRRENLPASVIGAALDLVVSFENGRDR